MRKCKHLPLLNSRVTGPKFNLLKSQRLVLTQVNIAYNQYSNILRLPICDPNSLAPETLTFSFQGNSHGCELQRQRNNTDRLESPSCPRAKSMNARNARKPIGSLRGTRSKHHGRTVSSCIASSMETSATLPPCFTTLRNHCSAKYGRVMIARTSEHVYGIIVLLYSAHTTRRAATGLMIVGINPLHGTNLQKREMQSACNRPSSAMQVKNINNHVD